ncbi:FBP domain-containing protein [Agromyces mediolanus]|uniref:FBP domain-containing protein n=1 Tax=Agromyces mediolanus TaxID=41986 RepID=UPI0020405DD0|nr:FBP domain-containing protein [Agromyces mediolanus]MCM3657992.1 FBP domain-containing protein [Agromyces mediolanus]
MRAMTPAEIRGSIRNADERVRRTMLLPRGLAELDWAGRDVLAWRDSRARHRGYLVRWAGRNGTPRPEGLLLTIARAPGRPDRAVMCTFCRFTARFEEVALFTAPRAGAAGLRGDTVGVLACEDLGCHARVRQPPLRGPLDPPVEEIVAARAAGLAERIDAFFADVLG